MGEIYVFNTLSGKKERFTTLRPGVVRMYVCGMTPYLEPHLGNARTFVAFDVIRRYFEYRGLRVLYVQNFTDIDDKIIDMARKKNVDPLLWAEKNIKLYFEAMDSIWVRRADIYPRVTDHIDDIIAFIEKLIRKGFAYVADGNVYYSVRAFPEYGKLSKRSADEMLAGARVEPDPSKRDPLDFALWKKAKPGEPCWDSPWGPGRPGWHIECSVMAIKYLGETFDIHGGGEDLIFPHHENEIAQSEAATGKTFARYWLHVGLLKIREEKMSKSLGNVFNVRDAIRVWSPQVVRFFLAKNHYRSQVELSDETLRESAESLNRISAFMHTLKELAQEGQPGSSALADVAKCLKERFVEAMDDDFSVPKALGALFEAVREANKIASKGSLPEYERAGAHVLLREISSIVEGVLGVPVLSKPQGIEGPLIDLILKVRDILRKEKRFDIADMIRGELGKLGIAVEDTPKGARWRWVPKK